MTKNLPQMQTPQKFGTFVVDWFAKHRRALPWREKKFQKNPYAIWISEVMLQQTQAERVVPFFLKFMTRFPDVKSLAEAHWEEVLEHVRGLGYYRRFRNFLRASEVVVKDFKGKLPTSYEDLRKLPGVGDYTANAILAFAYGKEAVPVDTNVRQILVHVFGAMEDKVLRVVAAKASPKGRQASSS